MARTLIDTVRRVETPEGVAIGLRLAGPVVRVLAWMVDALLRSVIYTGLAILLAILGAAGQGVFFVCLFLGEWFYPVLFEMWMNGSTPGKRQFGLVVLHGDGTPIGWSSSILRNLLRAADFLPLAYAFGLLSMIVDRDFRRLGDLAAGTVVVYRDPEVVASMVPKHDAIAPSVPLDRDEQRAIIEFAERLPTWTEQRAAEMATLVRPLTDASGSRSVERLLGIANWLVGRH